MQHYCILYTTVVVKYDRLEHLIRCKYPELLVLSYANMGKKTRILQKFTFSFMVGHILTQVGPLKWLKVYAQRQHRDRNELFQTKLNQPGYYKKNICLFYWSV